MTDKYNKSRPLLICSRYGMYSEVQCFQGIELLKRCMKDVIEMYEF